MLRGWIAALVAILCAVLWPATGQAQDAETLEEARRAFDSAREAYEGGRFEEALEGFERSFELTGSPEILFNIGTVADRLRRDRLALDAYERYLEARPDSADAENVGARIRALRQALAEPDPVETPDEPAESGEADAPAGAGPTDRVDGEGESAGRLWTWVAAGGAVAFGAATALLWLDAQAIHEDLEARCSAEGCTEAQVDDSGGPLRQTLGNVAFGLSLASLATAAILFFAEGGGSSGEESSGGVVAFTVGPQSVTLRGRF